MRGVGYATVEIILLLLAAAVIGFLIAWILRRFLYNVDLGEYEERVRSAQAERRVAEQELADVREQSEAAADEIVVIQARLADMESEATALTADLGTARAAVTAKDGRIEQLESAMTGLEADLATAESELGRGKETIEQLRADLAAADSLREEVERRGAKIAELEVLVIEKESSDAPDAHVEELEITLAATQTELAEAQRRLTELEQQLATTVAPSVEPAPEAAEEPGSTEVAVAGEEPEAGTEAEIDDATPPAKHAAVAMMAEIAARTAGDDDAVEDDLKRIRGIGPKLEQLLKSMGITSFRQIARFEAADIAVVTSALGAFPGRIERDDWISGAAEQHEEKYGETL